MNLILSLFIPLSPLTRIPQIFVIKLIVFPLVSNMKPLYISRSLSVYLIVRQIVIQTKNATVKQQNICQSLVELRKRFIASLASAFLEVLFTYRVVVSDIKLTKS